jgi:8-oxo-dGTP pyrophosphatase MutT (NUDIX family)
MPNITVELIRSFFSSFHREEINNTALTRAGVLIPLFIKNGELSVVFTQRTEVVEHHKGQISFPGGTMDKVDSTIVDTALREAWEEVGVPVASVEVLGLLGDFCTPSGFCITPVVGFLPPDPMYMLNKIEVSEIFDVPISFFLDPRNERTEKRMRFDKMMNVYFYNYGTHEIWGATAEILRNFLQTLGTEINLKKTL